VTRTRTVAAPIEQVWALVSDPFHLPRWWPATARVEDVEDDGWTSVFSSAVTQLELEEEGDEATRVALTSEERLRGRYRLGGWLVRRAARRRLDEALDGIERAVAPE
jgi:uncharacterized protein YndB with AHSA1/START domain